MIKPNDSTSQGQGEGVNLESLAGRSVFVTGHTGFKGSWLSLWLSQLGAKVTGYALDPPTQPSHFELASISDELIADHRADLRDSDRLRAAIDQAEPDVVLHLAAQSVVRTGYQDPMENWDVNVRGTAAVLEAVRERGWPCVVLVITTDKVYENREQVWGYRETDPLGGHDPYSASKSACDLLCSSHRRSFFPPSRVADHGIKLATARAGNVLGGGDFTPHALVPDLIRARAAGEPLPVRSPHAVRPWQHVLDCLGGYLALTARMLESDDVRWCDAWNFGPMPGQEWPVDRLVCAMLRAGGDDATNGWFDASDPQQPHEAGVLRLAIDKAMWQLGWRPTWSLDEAVVHTARWYRAWADGEPIADLSRAQLTQYADKPVPQPV